ncbi:sodium channel protein Nach-like [Schistocerca nitens]|uniref:sodium channel protein Nach-like n=1 Tax=Schistocerca nitens TaxID=7011 RepID=UPI002119AC90|nr:sodium channel protein Nach-like [Schistocerca nitens]
MRRRTARFAKTLKEDLGVGSGLEQSRCLAALLGERGENLVWALAVCACAAGAVSLSWQAWRKFADSPIVTSVESTVYPLSRLPFPSVTICPSMCVRKSVAIRSLRRLLNDSTVPDEQLVAAVHALTFYNFQAPAARQRHLRLAAIVLRRLWGLNITEFLLQYFTTSLVFSRYCLGTVSSFARSAGRVHRRGDCSLRHAVGPGAAAGLQVILKPARLSEFLPPHPTFPPGLHIQVHNPFEFPDGRNNLFAQDRVPKVATIKVSPAFTESGGRRLRQVRPSLRNCFFNGEVPLMVYGGYSQSTCMLECRLQHTVNVCSCEPYLFRNMRSQ